MSFNTKILLISAMLILIMIALFVLHERYFKREKKVCTTKIGGQSEAFKNAVLKKWKSGDYETAKEEHCYRFRIGNEIYLIGICSIITLLADNADKINEKN